MNTILPGVTRRAVLRLAESEGLTIEERPFTVSEALQARRRRSSPRHLPFVLPVVEIDGVAIGEGRPGPIARAFRRLYGGPKADLSGFFAPDHRLGFKR